jgi:hypothetical protein
MNKNKEFFRECNYFKKNIVHTINYCLNKYGYNYIDENVRDRVCYYLGYDGHYIFYYDVLGLKLNHLKDTQDNYNKEENKLISLRIKFYFEANIGYVYSVKPEVEIMFAPNPSFKNILVMNFSYCYGYKIYSLDDMKIYLEMQFEDMQVLTKDEAMIRDIIL